MGVLKHVAPNLFSLLGYSLRSLIGLISQTLVSSAFKILPAKARPSQCRPRLASTCDLHCNSHQTTPLPISCNSDTLHRFSFILGRCTEMKRDIAIAFETIPFPAQFGNTKSAATLMSQFIPTFKKKPYSPLPTVCRLRYLRVSWRKKPTEASGSHCCDALV